MRIGVKACTIFVVLLFLGMIIAGEVDCLPFDSKWNVAAIEGWCGRAQQHFFVISSSLHAFSDLLILCLPIPVIWRLDLPRRKRMMLVGMFSGGLLYVVLLLIVMNCIERPWWPTALTRGKPHSTTVVSVVRIWSLRGGGWSDLLFNEWTAVLLSIIEPSMGICLACLPFLRPLFNKEARSRAGTRATDASKEQQSHLGNNEVQVTKETIVRQDDMEPVCDAVRSPQNVWTRVV